MGRARSAKGTAKEMPLLWGLNRERKSAEQGTGEMGARGRPERSPGRSGRAPVKAGGDMDFGKKTSGAVATEGYGSELPQVVEGANDVVADCTEFARDDP